MEGFTDPSLVPQPLSLQTPMPCLLNWLGQQFFNCFPSLEQTSIDYKTLGVGSYCI